MDTLAPPPPRAKPARRFHVPSQRDRDAPVPHGVRCTRDEYLGVHLSPVGVEWVDGFTEYLPVPSNPHQDVAAFVYDRVRDVVRGRTPPAKVRFAGQNVLTPGTPGRSRQPDVAVMLDRDDPRVLDDAWDGADLLIEVVSPDDPLRDTRDKRLDYAAAGVPEYWIVDPRPGFRTVSVLTLDGGGYAARVFTEGETAASTLLPGLTVDVSACFAAR